MIPPGTRLPALIALALALVSGGFYTGFRWQVGAVAKARAETANLRADYAARARQQSEDYRAMEQAWQRENARIGGAYRDEIAKREADLANERNRNADLGRRLLRVSANLATSDQSAEAQRAGFADAAAALASREEELAAAVTEYDRSCQLDAVQLSALQEWAQE